jgi:hypothetical protein
MTNNLVKVLIILITCPFICVLLNLIVIEASEPTLTPTAPQPAHCRQQRRQAHPTHRRRPQRR